METTKPKPGLNLNRLLRHSDLALAIGLLAVLLVMILPIPSWLMDILLAFNLAISIAILLVGVYSGRPLEFSVFPSVLLFTTLFRLSLNVASTRLVLLNGSEGTRAAGRIIETFGSFVVGGSYVVGLVVFILLIIINFVVITKGSGRVAEVAARFILDSMPGKQMAIDADLNAGLINEQAARDRRQKIEQEADFYGAMDGASKFVRGDAIAGILITLVNIIGGLAIGVLQKGMPLTEAAQIYTLMTIGDGLVSQIPALIVSTAAGIVVTRAASGAQFSQEVAKQIFLQPRAIGVTAWILLVLAMLPGVPAFPFLFLGALAGMLSFIVRREARAESAASVAKERQVQEQAAQDTAVPPEVDTLELQVGFGLVSLVDGENKSELIDRIYQLRKEFARDLGIVVPKVRIKDNLELQPGQYSVLIKGVPVGGGELMAGYILAMDPGSVENPVSGVDCKEPVFGLPALWITDKQREKAQMSGYTVVDHPTIIATHLSEIVRKHAAEFIGRQELQALIDNVAKTHPKVIEELIPSLLPLGGVLKVCQGLLREQVPIRDLLTILETLANHAAQDKSTESLSEHCRTALARSITNRLTLGSTELEVINFEPKTEETLIRAHTKTDQGTTLNLEPGFVERLVLGLQRTLEGTVFQTGNAVLLCHPVIRGPLKKLLDRFVPNLSVLSVTEVWTAVRVKSVATVGA